MTWTRIVLPGLIAVCVVFWAACGGGDPPGPQVPGRAQYVFYCGACHGKDGLGSKHLFPPLAGSEWALGSSEVPIRVVLHGLEGRLRIKGTDYMNIMPPLDRTMDDETIALVLTYVRSAWGNQSPPVTAEEVARVREETKSRDEKYQVAEIEALRRELGED